MKKTILLLYHLFNRKKLYMSFIILSVGLMNSKADLLFPVNPITPDSNTVLLDHFDSITSGQVIGDVRYSISAEGLSTCVNFQGKGNYILYQGTYDLGKRGTIEMWIFPNIYSKGLINIGGVFQLRLDSIGKIVMTDVGSPGNDFKSNSGVMLNAWTHIAVSWGDSTKIYLNGQLDMVSAQSFRPQIPPSQTFIYFPATDNDYNTMIDAFMNDYLNMDELHISKIQRTNAEIAFHSRFNIVGKTIQLSAGTLAQLITSADKNVTNSLTLTGTMDARDFKTMRDSMPSLDLIDLKNVTISPYTGTHGTAGPDNVYYPANAIPQKAFFHEYYYDNKLISVYLPLSITAIGDYAFENWTGLTAITLPNSLQSIGNSAFYDCPRLSNIHLPDSLISIGDSAFTFCRRLPGVILPNSVTTMGKYAFMYCDHLSDVTLSNSLNMINVGAFESSRFFSLELTGKFVIPNSVTSIGDWAFYRSRLSGQVVIPNSVTSIGGAFGESSITSIIIPNSVITIKGGAFYRTNLPTVYVYSPIPIYLDPVHAQDPYGVFFEAQISTLYVPYGSKALYQAANQWQDFPHIVEMAPTGINELSDKDHFILYPNPATEGFYIDAVDKPVTVSVYNSTGVLLLSKQVSARSYVNMARLPQGQYVVKITTVEGILVKKLIKK